MMAKSHYLPSEVLTASNYPEVKGVQAELDRIFDFAMEVDRAVFAYNSGDANKIDVNSVAVEAHIMRCRDVCTVLGTASRVCFDVLLEVRRLQDSFQELLFLKRRYGDEYIGAPTASYDTDYGEEGGIG